MERFWINNETGALLVEPGADLDVDDITQYNLTVMIVDGGGLNNTVDVIIFILNYYTNNLCTRTAGCEDVCTMIVTTEDDLLAIDSATKPTVKFCS